MRNRNEIYHKLLSSYTWTMLRKSYLSKHPLCERCEAKGRTTPAEEVHHVKPVEASTTEEGMRRLAYDPGNLMALCQRCHKAMHERNDGTRDEAKEEAEMFIKQWIKDL